MRFWLLLGALVLSAISADALAVNRGVAPIELPASARPDLAGIVDASTDDDASQSWLTSESLPSDTVVTDRMKADWPKGRCVRIDSIRMPGLQLISKQLETRVSAMVQPHARQCVDPSRLDALTRRINEVLRVDGKPEAVAELPDRPIVNGVLTLRFRDAAMAARRARPSGGGTSIRLRSPEASAVSTTEQPQQKATVKTRVMPVYGLGRWTDNTERPVSSAVPPVHAASNERKDPAPRVTLQRVQNHWLGSHLQFAGNTAHSDEGHQGRIGVAANGLVQADHDMRLDFNESASQRVENESETIAFSYSFPLGANRFSLYANSYEYQSTVVGDEGKYEASGEGRNFNVSNRRSLFSWAGISFDSVMSLSSSHARYFEQGEWIEDSARQLSKFTFEGLTHNNLWFDVLATTRISASGGLEVFGKDYDMEESLEEDQRFHKFSISSTLSKELYRWNWGVTGRYQFTPNDLPDSEYLLVAGPSMIAGFNGQTLAAAEGGWLRLDANSPPFFLPLLQDLRSDIRFSVLQGWVPDNDMQSDRFGTASAAEISLQFQGRGLRADVSVGRMLGASSLSTNKPDVPDVSLSLSVGL